ncbi:hypothetical protein [Pelosinus sp. sgz500959]|uniref:hypothetical protein n=1 Tax=Pelosinus sp. sgz500959 TaxID=3242472 RepID=UPI00366D9AE9
MYLHVYKNNPTEGGVDGSQVSEGTELNPITTSALNGTNNEESASIKLALRCDTGYNTSGNTTVAPMGASASKWTLSIDGTTWGAYGAALTISTVIGVINTVFYCKAKAVSGESPANDVSVDLQISGNVVAV